MQYLFNLEHQNFVVKGQKFSILGLLPIWHCFDFILDFFDFSDKVYVIFQHSVLSSGRT